MKRNLAVIVVGIAVVAAACGETPSGDVASDVGGAQTTDAPTAAPTTSAPATTVAAGPEVALASGDLGDHLVDGDGYTLYLFVPDDAGDSTCIDSCAATWPPMLGEATAGDGVDASLLGASERSDGGTQVTYNGWPLYYYGADSAPGDTKGQGVSGVWYVVGASGEAADEAADEAGDLIGDYYRDY
jgi:predicted lipoprotein with Yx(FWY)xxD motif